MDLFLSDWFGKSFSALHVLKLKSCSIMGLTPSLPGAWGLTGLNR